MLWRAMLRLTTIVIVGIASLRRLCDGRLVDARAVG
jgi:hypothetical protein